MRLCACVCVCMYVVSVFEFSRSVNVCQRVEGGWVSIFFFLLVIL